MISNKAIYDMVNRIPNSKVATYGQIATLLGHPKNARQIGHALSQLDNNSAVPWHRVVNANGKISSRGLNGCDDYQKILLEDEGVKFNDKSCILLKEFQWQTNS